MTERTEVLILLGFLFVLLVLLIIQLYRRIKSNTSTMEDLERKDWRATIPYQVLGIIEIVMLIVAMLFVLSRLDGDQ
jgi:hypothetical protein